VTTRAETLLSTVAAALNACERAGLIIDNLQDRTVWTRAGYVVPFGDERLGTRWTVRARIPPPPPPPPHGGRTGMSDTTTPEAERRPERDREGE